jgi:hypothetical protein
MREKTNNNDSAEDALRTVLDILTIMTARNHLARINDPVQSSVENNPGKTTTPVDCLNVSQIFCCLLAQMSWLTFIYSEYIYDLHSNALTRIDSSSKFKTSNLI